ncbi:probable WRKY transcription factor 53 [Telopea speciosissima]|uniref:probable WRKY transcription factor 53 n=1 Tax=Telopea speciosissima TaxID=54955 RepID=UPI001CC3FF7C|nr:probable WRKY transcription factor 53 [Telopea speciosissima]
MENSGDWEQKTLLNELMQGKDLVKQLQMHLDPSSSDDKMRNLFVEKILSSYDKALSMLKWGGSDAVGATAGMLGSPGSDSGSLLSEDSDRRDIYKKRKILPRWTEQVRVSSETGIEGPRDDGYGWRKYGQKDILGAKYPRGYYRCTHRNVQGCLATKQVQRSDEDSSIFEVTYRGRHTCIQASYMVSAMRSSENSKQGPKQDHVPQKQQNQQEEEQKTQEILLDFRTGLKVRTQDLDTTVENQFMSSPSFSLPSIPIGCLKTENHIFSSPTVDHDFMGSFSPSFVYPVTTESNYFPVSPCRVNSFGGDGSQNLQTSECDLNEIISAVTSATNSPTVDLDFPIEFDPYFPFNSPDFFPS